MQRRADSVSAPLPALSPTRRCAWLLLVAVLGAVALTGCGRKAPAGTGPTETAAADTGSADEHDPCSLLDPKEVEAVLGGPLATPPFRSSNGDPFVNGDQCTYEDAHFHRLVVEVEWDGATMAWKMLGNVQAMLNQGPTKGMLHLADGSDLAGTWDEARVQGCCTFATLLGDQSVSVDGEDSNVSIPAAARLADTALKRLEKPLTIDGNQGVGAAKGYEAAHRPKRRDPCSLLTRAEAEAIIGPLSADPQARGDTCEYDRTVVGRMGGNVREVLEIEAHWTFGYQELNQNVSLLQGFAKGFTAGMPSGKKVEAALRGDQLPASPYWEVAYAGATRSGGLAAVKNDVMIGVNGLGIPREQGLSVLQKVMSKL